MKVFFFSFSPLLSGETVASGYLKKTVFVDLDHAMADIEYEQKA